MNDLPRGWSAVPLGDLFHGGLFSDGDWVEKKDQDPDGDVRLTQLADVGVGTFRDRSSRFLTAESAANLNCTFLSAGDILVARMPDPLGRACILPELEQKSVTAVDVCILRPTAHTNRKYLMWWLNSPVGHRQMVELQSGTTRKRISRKNLATITTPLPPLAEQERIVAAIEEHFSHLDAAEASLHRALRNLERMLSAHLHQLLDGYRIEQLGDLAKIKAGPFGSSLKKSFYTSSGYKIYGQEQVLRGDPDFGDYWIDETRYKSLEACAVRPGDLLISLVGTIGKTLVLPEGIAPGIINPRLLRLRADARTLDTRFLEVVLRSPQSVAQLKLASHGGTMDVLNSKMLKALHVSIPPLDRQREIVEEFNRARDGHAHVYEEIERGESRSSQLRRAVLSDAFSGQLVPQDRADEPASVLLDRIRADVPTMKTPTRKRKSA